MDVNTDRPSLVLGGEPTASFDLIVGADGGKSCVRRYVTAQQPRYAGYTVYRGLVRAQGIQGPPSGSARINGAYYETLGFPCDSPHGTLWNCGVYMAMPEALAGKNTRNRQVTRPVRNAEFS